MDMERKFLVLGVLLVLLMMGAEQPNTQQVEQFVVMRTTPMGLGELVADAEKIIIGHVGDSEVVQLDSSGMSAFRVVIDPINSWSGPAFLKGSGQLPETIILRRTEFDPRVGDDVILFLKEESARPGIYSIAGWESGLFQIRLGGGYAAPQRIAENGHGNMALWPEGQSLAQWAGEDEVRTKLRQMLDGVEPQVADVFTAIEMRRGDAARLGEPLPLNYLLAVIQALQQ
jgi:hypothetical protein